MPHHSVRTIALCIGLFLFVLPVHGQTTNDLQDLGTTREELRQQYIEAHEAGNIERKRQILERMEALQYAPPPESQLDGSSAVPDSTSTPSTGQNPGNPVLLPTPPDGLPGPSLGQDVSVPGTSEPPSSEAPKSILDGLKFGGGTNLASWKIPAGNANDSGNESKKTPDWKERTDVGVDFTIFRKSGDLEKFETESAKDFKEREDLAKGRANVRFGSGAANAGAGAKWNIGTGEVFAGTSAGANVTGASAEAEGRIGNDIAALGGKASGSVLTAAAKISTKIGNSEDFAGAKFEAGIGGSVAEGKLSGTVGSDWLGINVTGEVSGSVLTAEAKGTASAGFNKETERFEVEVGGKIGALIAGGGAKVKIALNKPGWWPW